MSHRKRRPETEEEQQEYMKKLEEENGHKIISRAFTLLSSASTLAGFKKKDDKEPVKKTTVIIAEWEEQTRAEVGDNLGAFDEISKSLKKYGYQGIKPSLLDNKTPEYIAPKAKPKAKINGAKYYKDVKKKNNKARKK